MYRILIVEDDAGIAEAVSEQAKMWNFETHSVTNFRNVMAEFAEFDPHLVLMDIGLPFFNGYYWCGEIRKVSRVPVIFISSASDNMNIVMAMNIGADDYMTKPFNPLELVARVKSQLRRYTQLGSTARSDNQSEFRTGGLVIRDDLKEVTVDGEKVKLTPIEYNILLLLVKNQGKVFSINQIYENIWNEEAIGADNTVAVHIRHIREKIEINPKEPRYLKVVWGVGYKVEKIG